MDTTAGIGLLISLIGLLKILILARVLLSWINVDWYRMPFKLLDMVTEPVMAPLRKIIPPLGGLDISPILLFFLLDMLANFLRTLAI